MAALVMETTGTQEYVFEPEKFLTRISKSYGAQAAAEVGARAGLASPALVMARALLRSRPGAASRAVGNER
jgi:hypothetical protein